MHTQPEERPGVPDRVVRWLWIAAAVAGLTLTVVTYSLGKAPGFPEVLVDIPVRTLLGGLLVMFLVGMPLQAYYEFRTPRPD